MAFCNPSQSCNKLKINFNRKRYFFENQHPTKVCLRSEVTNFKICDFFQGEGALAIGTQVSAKYKGAFCEAKVRSVDKQVKCRVTFKMGLGSTTISDKDIKTDKPLVQGATVLAKHPDKQEYFEAIVKEIKVSKIYCCINSKFYAIYK